MENRLGLEVVYSWAWNSATVMRMYSCVVGWRSYAFSCCCCSCPEERLFTWRIEIRRVQTPSMAWNQPLVTLYTRTFDLWFSYNDRTRATRSSSSSIYLDKTKHKCQGHVGTYRPRCPAKPMPTIVSHSLQCFICHRLYRNSQNTCTTAVGGLVLFLWGFWGWTGGCAYLALHGRKPACYSATLSSVFRFILLIITVSNTSLACDVKDNVR